MNLSCQAAARHAAPLDPAALATERISIRAPVAGVPLAGLLLASLSFAVSCAGPLSQAMGAEPPWEFDRVVLQQGDPLEGLLLDEGPREVEFAIIRRPAGRPMQAVIKPVDRSSILRIDRIEATRRTEMMRRFEAFRSRARIEAGRLDSLQLRKAVTGSGAEARAYQGPWFQLSTTLDEPAARRCIIRIEQVFRAYRNLLGPDSQPTDRRSESRKPLQIVITGTGPEFQQLLAEHALRTTAPAVYLPGENRILVATDLRPLARQLAASRKRNVEQTDDHQQQLKEFPLRFAGLSRKLRAKGYSAEEIAAEKRAREAALERDGRNLLARIAESQRRNDAQFAARTHRAFRRLYHEAFHAYLQNHFSPQQVEAIPRWLNEGLAQIFEHGQLDGDFFRIDQPAPQLAAELLAEFARQPKLPVPRLLQSSAADFHWHDSRAAADSQRFYIRAWGLAYYLVFQQGASIGQVLRDFSSRGPEPPVQQLERLVDAPLAEFETRWQATFADRQRR